MEDQKSYWEHIYSKNEASHRSWFQERPSLSLRFIEATGIARDQAIIDVGGGESLLVDNLLFQGFTHLTVLDISSKALVQNKKRLAEKANTIQWIEADVTNFRPKQKYALWHDRAVFHFLTKEEDRLNYLSCLRNTLIPLGHLVIATFTIGGPTRCSGLDIVRYDRETLSRFFGEEFELKSSEIELHLTPWGSEQKFLYCRFQRR